MTSDMILTSEAFGMPPTPLLVPCTLPAGRDEVPAGPHAFQWQLQEDIGVPILKHFPHAWRNLHCFAEQPWLLKAKQTGLPSGVLLLQPLALMASLPLTLFAALLDNLDVLVAPLPLPFPLSSGLLFTKCSAHTPGGGAML